MLQTTESELGTLIEAMAEGTRTPPSGTSVGLAFPSGIGTMHVILAVTDRGSPPLTRFQRVIIDVTP